jgi:hypothetical protein
MPPFNKLAVATGLLQLASAVESACNRNYKMAAVFAAYAACSIILAFVK